LSLDPTKPYAPASLTERQVFTRSGLVVARP
jgi:hypothetical protein